MNRPRRPRFVRRAAGVMDPLLHYRRFDAVRRGLERAGLFGFELFDAECTAFEDTGMSSYLERRGATRILIEWEGRALPDWRRLDTDRDGWSGRTTDRRPFACFVVDGEAAVLNLLLYHGDQSRTFVIAGERRSGALDRLLDAYGRDSRRRALERPTYRELPAEEERPLPDGLAWDDVVLPAPLRREIRLQVESFFTSRARFRRLDIPYRRGLLFAGPPGNGKTTLIRVIAAAARAPFFHFVPSPDTGNDALDRAFRRAAFHAPSILCFEDLDTLFKGSITLSHFVNRLDGLAPLEGVLVLATTNRPDAIDPALSERPSRFDRTFFIDLPAERERQVYLARRFPHRIVRELLRLTDGCSVAQLQELGVTAALEAMKRSADAPDLRDAFEAAKVLRGQREEVVASPRSRRLVGFRPPPRPSAHA